MFKLYQTKMSSGPDDKSFVLTQDEDAEGPVCFTCLCESFVVAVMIMLPFKARY
jgi:hypothetical protein